jgi:hypothetical protein
MYRLIRFGITDLEYTNQVDTVGSGATPMSYVGLPEGGALDGYGSGSKQPGVVERSKRVRLNAPNAAALEAAYFGLMGLRGKRDKLYRRTVLGDIHWMYARLVELIADRSYEQARYQTIQDIELRFACQEATWRGSYRGSWVLDSGVYLDSGYDLDTGETRSMGASPDTFTISAGSSSDSGRAPVRSLSITVTNGAGATAITAMAIINQTTGDSLTFSGNLPAGKALNINAGTMQVRNDGVDAYASLTLAPAANMASWFTLVPGNNSMRVAYTGGTGGANPTISFDFYEAWV